MCCSIINEIYHHIISFSEVTAMKTLLISDMHSCIKSLEALEQAEKTWDQIICLGDMVDFGLNPHEVIEWCKKHNVIAVAGNHDRELPARAAKKAPLEDPMTATTLGDYNLSKVTAEDIEYLNSLPDKLVLEIDGGLYCFFHVYDERKMHIAKKAFIEHNASELFDRMWSELAEDVKFDGKRYIVNGHTHQLTYAAVDGNRAFINPGSLFYRVLKDGPVTTGGDYFVIQDGVISARHIDYDNSEAKAVFDALPLNEGNRNIGTWFFGKE